LVREWKGKLERVTVLEKGFTGTASLFQPFAGREGDDRHCLERPPLLPLANGGICPRSASAPRDGERGDRQAGCRVGKQTDRASLLFTKRCGRIMKPANPKASLRCAVYTGVSTEHGLKQEFNSLDNQREASEVYIKSQAHEG
jgi:hypothetical protein